MENQSMHQALQGALKLAIIAQYNNARVVYGLFDNLTPQAKEELKSALEIGYVIWCRGSEFRQNALNAQHTTALLHMISMLVRIDPPSNTADLLPFHEAAIETLQNGATREVLFTDMATGQIPWVFLNESITRYGIFISKSDLVHYFEKRKEREQTNDPCPDSPA